MPQNLRFVDRSIIAKMDRDGWEVRTRRMSFQQPIYFRVQVCCPGDANCLNGPVSADRSVDEDCENGGQLIVKDGIKQCMCPVGFRGQVCQYPDLISRVQGSRPRAGPAPRVLNDVIRQAELWKQKMLQGDKETRPGTPPRLTQKQHMILNSMAGPWGPRAAVWHQKAMRSKMAELCKRRRLLQQRNQRLQAEMMLAMQMMGGSPYNSPRSQDDRSDKVLPVSPYAARVQQQMMALRAPSMARRGPSMARRGPAYTTVSSRPRVSGNPYSRVRPYVETPQFGRPVNKAILPPEARTPWDMDPFSQNPNMMSDPRLTMVHPMVYLKNMLMPEARTPWDMDPFQKTPVMMAEPRKTVLDKERQLMAMRAYYRYLRKQAEEATSRSGMPGMKYPGNPLQPVSSGSDGGLAAASVNGMDMSGQLSPLSQDTDTDEATGTINLQPPSTQDESPLGPADTHTPIEESPLGPADTVTLEDENPLGPSDAVAIENEHPLGPTDAVTTQEENPLGPADTVAAEDENPLGPADTITSDDNPLGPSDTNLQEEENPLGPADTPQVEERPLGPADMPQTEESPLGPADVPQTREEMPLGPSDNQGMLGMGGMQSGPHMPTPEEMTRMEGCRGILQPEMDKCLADFRLTFAQFMNPEYMSLAKDVCTHSEVVGPCITSKDTVCGEGSQVLLTRKMIMSVMQMMGMVCQQVMARGSAPMPEVPEPMINKGIPLPPFKQGSEPSGEPRLEAVEQQHVVATNQPVTSSHVTDSTNQPEATAEPTNQMPSERKPSTEDTEIPPLPPTEKPGHKKFVSTKSDLKSKPTASPTTKSDGFTLAEQSVAEAVHDTSHDAKHPVIQQELQLLGYPAWLVIALGGLLLLVMLLSAFVCCLCLRRRKQKSVEMEVVPDMMDEKKIAIIGVPPPLYFTTAVNQTGCDVDDLSLPPLDLADQSDSDVEPTEKPDLEEDADDESDETTDEIKGGEREKKQKKEEEQ